MLIFSVIKDKKKCNAFLKIKTVEFNLQNENRDRRGFLLRTTSMQITNKVILFSHFRRKFQHVLVWNYEMIKFETSRQKNTRHVFIDFSLFVFLSTNYFNWRGASQNTKNRHLITTWTTKLCVRLTWVLCAVSKTILDNISTASTLSDFHDLLSCHGCLWCLHSRCGLEIG